MAVCGAGHGEDVFQGKADWPVAAVVVTLVTGHSGLGTGRTCGDTEKQPHRRKS